MAIKVKRSTRNPVDTSQVQKENSADLMLVNCSGCANSLQRQSGGLLLMFRVHDRAVLFSYFGVLAYERYLQAAPLRPALSLLCVQCTKRHT